MASRLLLRFLCIFFLAHATTAQDITISTLTTLPPAAPTGSDPDPCDFTDRSSLLSRIESDPQGYNISLLVQTCPQVCPLVYGSGNPDISGIGAVTSYVLQAITTFSFGLLLANFAVIFELEVVKPSSRVTKCFDAARRIAYSVTKTNIYVSLTIAIASLIRLIQAPLLDEKYFIFLLGLLQWFIYTGAFISFLLYQQLGRETTIVYVCYSLLLAALLFTNLYVALSFRLDTMTVLTFHCVAERQDSIFPNSGNPLDPLLFLKFMIAPWTVMGFTLFYYVFPRIRKPQPSWRGRLKNHSLRICGLHMKTIHYILVFGVFIATAGWISCIMILMMMLENSRKMLQRASGASYEDSQWGFGQVAAVMAWAPLLHEFVFEVMDLQKALKTESIGGDEQQLLPVDATRTVSAAVSIEINTLNGTDGAADAADCPLNNIIEQATPSAAPLLQPNENGGGNTEPIDLQVNRTNPLMDSDDTITRRSEMRSFSIPVPVHSSGSEDLQAGQDLTRRQTTWPRNETGTYLPTSLSPHFDHGRNT